jgi:hypothetical protein
MSDTYIEEDGDEDYMVVTFKTKTRMMRFSGNGLSSSSIRIKAVLVPDPTITQGEVEHAMVKVNYFFDQLVNDCIAFSFDNKQALNILFSSEGRNQTGNLLMITPYDPSDELMATLFQAKITALSMGKILVESCEVESDLSGGLSFTFVGEGANLMPTMEEWLGDRSYFDEPWWMRNDASVLDVIPPEGADLAVKPAWAYSLDTVLAPKAATGTIVRPEFRPKVLPGGKA